MVAVAKNKDEKPKDGGVRIDREAVEALASIAEWTGQSQRVIATRVLVWLSQQDQDVQGAIVGALPLTRRDEFAEAVLRRLAAGREADQDVAGQIRPGGEDRTVSKPEGKSSMRPDRKAASKPEGQHGTPVERRVASPKDSKSKGVKPD